MTVSQPILAAKSRQSHLDRSLGEGGFDATLNINPDELLRLAEEVKAVQFSPYLMQWIENYEKRGQRGRFLWQWCLKGVGMTTLPSVPKELRQHVIETKMLSILFGTLMDDIADREQDREMLESAIALANDEWSGERLFPWDERRRAYGEVIATIWSEVWGRCRTYPKFSTFEHLLRFDNQQTLNAMRYALIINQQPSLLNTIEHDLYQPHNMQIIFMATMDLCASPSFDLNELGIAREVFWHAQRMGRIGNMITTWEREVLDRDFSSGVFSHAINRGILQPVELSSLPAHEIMTILENAGCQEHFIQEWEEHRARLEEKIQNIRSVDLQPYLSAYEQLIKLHLCSRGLM
jgi:hypothetical protein